MNNSPNDRRSFLVESARLAGVGWLALNTPMLLAVGSAADERRAAAADWANMSPLEAAAFAAVADQIIPPDHTPGAAEIGVVYFIDQALGGFMAGQAVALKAGLADLDRLAREAHGVSGGGSGGSGNFAELAFDRQTELLRGIEATPFFKDMIFLTHCGMFAMPSWGGNRDLGGWALLGFDSRHAWQPPFGFYDAQAQESNHDKG
ncbi:MAG: gluconate 2-dehydrogenase subunit 3 family protein [Lysobacterales bacterium]